MLPEESKGVRKGPPTYLITCWVSGKSGEIDIELERFERTRAAKDGILFGIDLEEKLALVLANYREFEGDVFAHGLSWAIHENWRWESRRDQVFELNRRLFNLVNAIWMYHEHLDRELRRCSRRVRDVESIWSRLEQRLTAAFLKRPLLAIRLLRDYCQHQGLGFRGVGVKNSRYELQRLVSRGPCEERLFTTAVLSVSTAELTVSRSKKGNAAKQVLQDLQKEPTWDPAPDLREAIDELTKAHCEMRAELSQDLRSWREDLEWIIETADREFSSLVGLCVIKRYGRGHYDEPIQIFRDFLDRLEELQQKNSEPTKLVNRIVTTVDPLAQP